MTEPEEPRPPADGAESAAREAPAATNAIDEHASFGIEEGEVDQLEKKWNLWSFDVEENKRLVLDEVEDVAPTPSGLASWDDAAATPRGSTRARRRSAWAQRVVGSSPVFYGWVVAALVALAALIVSPAQVYCVGQIVEAQRGDLSLGTGVISGMPWAPRWRRRGVNSMTFAMASITGRGRSTTSVWWRMMRKTASQTSFDE